MLPFRLFPIPSAPYPLMLYSCGLHDQTYQYRPQGYPVLQCFLNFGGHGTFQFSNHKDVTLAPLHLLLLPANVTHEYYPHTGESWLLGFLGIHGTGAETMLRGLGLPLMTCIPLEHSAGKLLESKLADIWKSGLEESNTSSGHLSIQLYELLILLSQHTIKRTSSVVPNHSNAPQDALRLAVQYMKQHYDEDLLIANVAQAVGYSTQHFQRIFRQTYGINPHAYLQRIRLEQAAAWLESKPEYSIQEISHRLGMDTSYFIRIFKKKHGVTPRCYRSAYIHHLPEPTSSP